MKKILIMAMLATAALKTNAQTGEVGSISNATECDIVVQSYCLDPDLIQSYGCPMSNGYYQGASATMPAGFSTLFSSGCQANQAVFYRFYWADTRCQGYSGYIATSWVNSWLFGNGCSGSTFSQTASMPSCAFCCDVTSFDADLIIECD
jgi:hypothetical protein